MPSHSPGAAAVWQIRVNPHPVQAHLFDPADHPYLDVLGPIGIVSTPVVDESTNTLYVVAASCDPTLLNRPDPQAAFKQLLFALNAMARAVAR